MSVVTRRAYGYDARMAYEIAQGMEDPAAVAERYGLTPGEWGRLVKHKPFLMAVARYRKELKDTGYTFRTKASMQAEDLLATAYLMAKDPETPSNVRADLIKWTTKVAGLEPDGREAGSRGTAGAFQININLGEGGKGKNVVIDGQALPPA